MGLEGYRALDAGMISYEHKCVARARQKRLRDLKHCMQGPQRHLHPQHSWQMTIGCQGGKPGLIPCTLLIITLKLHKRRGTLLYAHAADCVAAARRQCRGSCQSNALPRSSEESLYI